MVSRTRFVYVAEQFNVFPFRIGDLGDVPLVDVARDDVVRTVANDAVIVFIVNPTGRWALGRRDSAEEGVGTEKSKVIGQCSTTSNRTRSSSSDESCSNSLGLVPRLAASS